MVVMPKQLKELTKDEERTLKRLEKKIDGILRDEFSPYRAEELCIDVPEDLNYGSRIYQRLVQMYKDAGWIIKYESCQRDGDFLSFTPLRRER